MNFVWFCKSFLLRRGTSSKLLFGDSSLVKLGRYLQRDCNFQFPCLFFEQICNMEFSVFFWVGALFVAPPNICCEWMLYVWGLISMSHPEFGGGPCRVFVFFNQCWNFSGIEPFYFCFLTYHGSIINLSLSGRVTQPVVNWCNLGLARSKGWFPTGLWKKPSCRLRGPDWRTFGCVGFWKVCFFFPRSG